MTIFYIGIALIIFHEVDAVRCKEWRIFPGLSLLSDKMGRFIFLVAHIPLLLFLFWKLTSGADLTMFRLGFNVFLIAHLVLHVIYLKDKNNAFKDWISWTIIAGTAGSGILDLLLNYT